ncbi:MAG: choice-of-anchor D domain-containing protein, partial [Gemmatimonadetes bacterium]|nr:choice-of-anchor D domain-containing protein [Gemmatimonadota bacterium]
GDGVPDLAVANMLGQSVSLLLNEAPPAQPVIGATPGTLQFGTVALGVTTAPAEVRIANLGSVELEVTSVSLTGRAGAEYRVSHPPLPLRAAPGGSFPVHVSFRPVAAGLRAATLRVQTAVPGVEPALVLLRGSGLEPPLPAVHLSPERIAFGRRQVGSTGSRELTLLNYGAGALRIEGMSLTGPGAGEFAFSLTDSLRALPLTVPAGGALEVLVRYAPRAPGYATAELVIADDAPDAPHAVSLSGTAVEQDDSTFPRIGLEPDTLAFGAQPVGGPLASRTLALANPGTAALTVSEISVAGGAPEVFEVSAPATPFVVPPGGAVELRVAFAPDVTGVREARLRVVSDASGSPYPASEVVGGVSWDFDRLVRQAPGSDLWPTTWGPDDELYTSWGDGGGFGGSNGLARTSLGFARIGGGPADFIGTNLWGGFNPLRPATFGGKASGMLSVRGILHAWVNLQNATPPDKALARSADLGLTWELGSPTFTGVAGGFYPVSFLNYGRDYAGARDGCVYVYGLRWAAEGNPFVAAGVYLARVPSDSLAERAAYEFFTRPEPDGPASWTPDETLASPVLEEPAGVTIPSVVHAPALGRYLLTTSHGGEVGRLSIFDAPEPWGPWTTVTYEDDWGGFGGEEALAYSIPTKWLGADGATLWMIFSATGVLDSFNLISGALSLRDPAVPLEPRTYVVTVPLSGTGTAAIPTPALPPGAPLGAGASGAGAAGPRAPQ